MTSVLLCCACICDKPMLVDYVICQIGNKAEDDAHPERAPIDKQTGASLLCMRID